jgi:hypothetical protein
MPRRHFLLPFPRVSFGCPEKLSRLCHTVRKEDHRPGSRPSGSVRRGRPGQIKAMEWPVRGECMDATPTVPLVLEFTTLRLLRVEQEWRRMRPCTASPEFVRKLHPRSLHQSASCLPEPQGWDNLTAPGGRRLPRGPGHRGCESLRARKPERLVLATCIQKKCPRGSKPRGL